MADDYERLTEKAELSYEEALALKGEMRKREKTGELAADLATQLCGTFRWWRTYSRP
jgi:hypothetical protein